MGFALRKRLSEVGAKDDVPIKERFRAWWNGYEVSDRQVAGAAQASHAQSDPDGPADEREKKGSAWNEARRQLAQEVWTPGFIQPGGAAYIEKLVSGCSLTAAETMLEIGIGMGGATRTIIGKFGNYVTAYEHDEELAAAARRYAVTYDFDEKLEIISAPIEELNLKSGYFRAALLRDVLFTVEDKQSVVTQVSNSLKPGDAYFVATDLLFDANDDSPELQAWLEVEEQPVYPWTEDEMTKCLESVRIRPRIVRDESEDYQALVVRAWSDYLKSIKGKEIAEDLARELAREGEFWARRMAAIESGALRYYRIEGVKVS